MPRKTSRSGFKGVYIRKNGGYTACIRAKNKNIYLGCFDDIEEAKKAYIEAKLEYGIVDKKNRTPKERRIDYRATHMDNERSYHREYRRKNSEIVRLYKAKYRYNNKEKINIKKNIGRHNNRVEVINYYGGVCVCCGESNIKLLTLDHTNGDGSIHRKEIGIKAGVHYCEWLKKNNFPKHVDVKVMCWNCNCAKKNNKECPHKSACNGKIHKRRQMIINKYGGSCKCCGENNYYFLTFDHINNDGSQHRKIIGKHSENLYKWICDNNFPDSIQILCWNCNSGRFFNGGICPHNEEVKVV